MHIAVIDDEKLLNRHISKKLENNWYKVTSFYSLRDFNTSDIDLKYFDLILVDIWLWDWSWFEIIKKVRQKMKLSIPIIIISWYNDKENIVYGLDLWADDYIKKPILPEELLARVKAISRRPQNLLSQNVLTYNNITLDVDSRELKIWVKKVDLSKKEIDIVELFIKNKWKIIPKNDFIAFWWWEEKILSVSDNTIYVTLSTIRKKLWSKFKLEAKKNLGYILT